MDSFDILAHSQETRIRQLEERMNLLHLEMVETQQTLKSNHDLIVKIEKNTEDLVNLFKGGKSLGNFVKWTAAILAGMGTVYIFFKETIKHLGN